MTFPGLVAANNLSDVANIETTWDNLGDGLNATVSGVVSTITIKGKDILALNGISRVSTADLVRTKGLTELVQPRITSASEDASTSAVLRDNALLKASPTSSGNYGIGRGTLSGNSLQINGFEVASISGVPFSGNTALHPLTISTLGAPTNFRINETMPTGVLSNPSVAIPIETDDLILYIKTGQAQRWYNSLVLGLVVTLPRQQI